MKSRIFGSVLVAVVSAVIVVGLLLFRNIPTEAAYPVERLRSAFVRNVWSRIRGAASGSEVAAENLRLRRVLAGLSLALGDSKRIEDENARLRRVLGYSERKGGAWMPVEVLSRGGGAVGSIHTLRIAGGSNVGIRTGAVVAVEDGLVGVISRVAPHTSEVSLITDPTVLVSCEVECAAPRRPTGILSGGTAEQLQLRHLSRHEDAVVGSRMVTTGFGGVFPRGLAVGVLRAVRQPTGGLAAEADVEPSVDFATLEDVFVFREK